MRVVDGMNRDHRRLNSLPLKLADRFSDETAGSVVRGRRVKGGESQYVHRSLVLPVSTGWNLNCSTLPLKVHDIPQWRASAGAPRLCAHVQRGSCQILIKRWEASLCYEG